MRKTYAILDLQYGSTGKGLLAGYLARKMQPDGVVSAFGPNAGHTFIDGAGRKFVHIMMPMGVLSPNIKRVFIGPGAIVNPEILLDEHRALKSMGYEYDLMIHENAAVVQQRHRDQEAEYGARIGSTQKGTGAALSEKILRKSAPFIDPRDGIVARDALKKTPLKSFVVSPAWYNDAMDKVMTLQIEGAQGFSLSCHHGFYPYTTSRDCTLASLLSDCAVPLDARRVYSFGVARTYPIRVNNKTGYSGPSYPDQKETTFEALGVPVELTTVTKLPRRVFTFSMQQIKDAVRMNATDAIFLNFCNYNPAIAEELAQCITVKTGIPVRWKGYGASETDVREET